jgi:hypothetical protein
MVSKDAENNNYDIDDKNKTSECLTFTPTKSPLTVSTNSYPSPFFIDFGLFSLSCPLLLFGLWDGEPLGEQAGEILDETLSRSNVE